MNDVYDQTSVILMVNSCAVTIDQVQSDLVQGLYEWICHLHSVPLQTGQAMMWNQAIEEASDHLLDYHNVQFDTLIRGSGKIDPAGDPNISISTYLNG